jgi:RNA polymerase sigma-70 factor, ECF subfamily
MGNAPFNETALINNAKNGDQNAFNQLVLSYASGVLNVVYRMCGNMSLAEDASQEAFIQAWVKLKSFRSDSSFKNWLYRIAINSAIDMMRKEKRILSDAIEDFHLADKNPGPENMYSINENKKSIQEAVLSLPDGSRSVLILREYEGLSYKDIANVLKLPVGTVMSRLNYARNLLKGKLIMPAIHSMEVENV